MNLYLRPLFVVVLLSFCSKVHCDEITLFPSQDASLYEEGPANENGLGPHLFTGANNGLDLRRSLLEFDIAGSLPPDAVVTRATLSLTVNQVPPTPITDTFGLHRVTTVWRQGDIAASREGRGDPGNGLAASWSSSGFETWEGGDFLETASSSTEIGPVGIYTWESTDSLIDDVQSWLENPVDNFGWALVGSELERQTAKRLGSSENPDEALRPALFLEFDIAEMLQGDFDGDGELLATDVNLLCAAIRGEENPSDFDLNDDGLVNIEDQRVWVEDVRGTFFGDTDLNGQVSFADFLTLSANFGESEAGWEHGDFDCNASVGFPDFLQLSASFGSEADAVSSVPEPNCSWLVFAVACVLGRGRRK